MTFELHKGAGQGASRGPVKGLVTGKSPKREEGGYLLRAKRWACSLHNLI